jgi:hypothetical protein
MSTVLIKFKERLWTIYKDCTLVVVSPESEGGQTEAFGKACGSSFTKKYKIGRGATCMLLKILLDDGRTIGLDPKQFKTRSKKCPDVLRDLATEPNTAGKWAKFSSN